MMGFFQCVGILTLALWAFSLLKFVFVRFLRSPRSWSQFRGDWAVVTGASKGIGKATAEALAQHGLNVVLVARSGDLLLGLANRLQKQYSVDARALVADFLSPTVWKQIEEQLKQITGEKGVSVLVNNVGAETRLQKWVESTLEETEFTTAVNLTPCLRMTRMLLPGMVSRGKGRIMCMSSMVSLICGVYVADYSSDKAKINQFCRALYEELKGTGVEIQSHALGLVATMGIKTNMYTCTAEEVSHSSLNMFGYGGPVVIPVLRHAIQQLVFDLPPYSIGSWIVRHLMDKERENLKSVGHIKVN